MDSDARNLIGTIRSDSIPVEEYISPSFAELEFKSGVWSRTWLMACRLQQLSKVGDFVTFEIGTDSILIVRSAPDQIVAHHNVCRHRGRRLKNASERSGNTNPLIFCRYHGWRWDLDGRISHVPARENWAGCPHFDDEDLALRSVRVDTWGGWVWINMDPGAEPLQDYLAPIPEYLDCFAFEDMRIVWSHTIRVPANWKTVIEAFNESYHAPTTHAQTNKFDRGFGSGQPTGAAHGRHGQMFIGAAFEQPIPENVDQREFYREFMTVLQEQFRAMYFEPSLSAANRLFQELPATASLMDVIISHFQFQREASEALGMRWPDELTLESVARAGFDWHVFPNAIILPTPDGVVTYRTRPDRGDPNFCFWDLECLARVPPGAEPTFEHQYFPDPQAFEGRNYLMEQDLQNIVEVQAGMRSSSISRVRLNPHQESVIANFHRELHQVIKDWLDEPEDPPKSVRQI